MPIRMTDDQPDADDSGGGFEGGDSGGGRWLAEVAVCSVCFH